MSAGATHLDEFASAAKGIGAMANRPPAPTRQQPNLSKSPVAYEVLPRRADMRRAPPVRSPITKFSIGPKA
jgi:hypothetical protein